VTHGNAGLSPKALRGELDISLNLKWLRSLAGISMENKCLQHLPPDLLAGFPNKPRPNLRRRGLPQEDRISGLGGDLKNLKSGISGFSA